MEKEYYIICLANQPLYYGIKDNGKLGGKGEFFRGGSPSLVSVALFSSKEEAMRTRKAIKKKWDKKHKNDEWFKGKYCVEKAVLVTIG